MAEESMTTKERLLASPEAQAAYRNSVLFHHLVNIVDAAERRDQNADAIETLGRALAAAMTGKAEWEELALLRMLYASPGAIVEVEPGMKLPALGCAGARYVELPIQLPEDCAPEVREFFERLKTGQVELHVVSGKVLGVDCHSQRRARPRSGTESTV